MNSYTLFILDFMMNKVNTFISRYMGGGEGCSRTLYCKVCMHQSAVSACGGFSEMQPHPRPSESESASQHGLR